MIPDNTEMVMQCPQCKRNAIVSNSNKSLLHWTGGLYINCGKCGYFSVIVPKNPKLDYGL